MYKNDCYTILSKENRIDLWLCDYTTYKKLHLIKCFFNKIKALRRVATRYDKLAMSFMDFVQLVSIWILFK